MDSIVLMEARRQGVGIVLSSQITEPGKLLRWMDQVYVVVDLAATPAEQRCTAMHELGHNALGHCPAETEDDYQAMELAADQWAAERLITDEALDDALEIARDTRELGEILMVDPNTLNARLGPARTQRSGLILISQVI